MIKSRTLAANPSKSLYQAYNSVGLEPPTKTIFACVGMSNHCHIPPKGKLLRWTTTSSHISGTYCSQEPKNKLLLLTINPRLQYTLLFVMVRMEVKPWRGRSSRVTTFEELRKKKVKKKRKSSSYSKADPLFFHCWNNLAVVREGAIKSYQQS